MDSQADDLDRELEAWLVKEAAVQGVDLTALRQQELEVWKRWKDNPNQQDFAWLYNSHKPIIYRAGEQYLKSAQIPKAAVHSDMLRNYIQALDKYDPNSGAAVTTYIFKNMQHTGRYLGKYQNIGKIPEDRRALIGLFQNRLSNMKELLGREPSNAELADDMTTSLQEVGALQKEIRLRQVSPKTVGILRKEDRRDLLAEAPGGETSTQSSQLLDHLIFMHGSLNPEQQTVLEHTFEGFGKPVIQDPMQLAPVLNMSPQKVRALRKQIADKVKKYY